MQCLHPQGLRLAHTSFLRPTSASSIVPVPSDPFALDERFRVVFGHLRQPSTTARWSVIRAIEALPSPKISEAEPYLLELAGPLCRQVRRMDPIGVHPERLAGAAGAVRQWEQACPDLGTLDVWGEAARRLEEGAARLFAFAGDPARAVQVMSRADARPGALVPVLDLPGEADPERVLRAFLNTVDLSSPVEKLLRQALNTLRDGPPGVYVPVVERPAQSHAATAMDGLGIGGLLRLHLTRTQETQTQEQAGSSAPFVLRIRGLEDFGRDRIAPVEQALARFTGQERRSGAAGQAVEVTLGCTPSGDVVSGSSFQLGAGSLALTYLVAHRAPRLRVRLASQVAMTGRVSARGQVEPVVPETLGVKVRTAFFSPVKTLAVPHGQEEDAEEALAALRDRFPCGELSVVGVRSLRDVLDRRRLTLRTEIGRMQHAAERATTYGATLALTGVALLLVGALAYVLMPPLDQTPVRAEYSGSTLTIENKYGQVIEQETVGAGIVNTVRAQQRSGPHAFLHSGSDGASRVAWAATGEATKEVIRMRRVGADTLIWERPVAPDVEFPQKPFASTPQYHVENLYAADTRGDEAEELYALLNHSPYFPGVLVELDPHTGDVLQQYVNPGHLTARLRHADLDGDGTAELITGGYSNAFQSPVVVVVSAEDFGGHAPATPAYTAAGVPPAEHYGYLRLPATPVQEASPKTFRLVRSTKQIDGDIRVFVEDGTRDDRLQSETELLLRLDADLQVVSVGTNSQHDRLARDLVAQGRLDAVPGAEALHEYKEEVRYWNGIGWERTPIRKDRQK